MRDPNMQSSALSTAMRLLAGAMVLCWVLFADRPAAAQVLEQDKVVLVPSSDQAMAQAIKRARTTLPDFFKILEGDHGAKHRFGLKVAVLDGKTVEHMWFLNLKQMDGTWVGVLDNTPRLVTNVKIGERYAIPHDNITDWMYTENGKIYGGYTIRVLADRVSAKDKAMIDALLAYEPK